MHTFDDMFSGTQSTDGAKAATDPWGADTSKSGDIPRNASSSGLDDLAGLDQGFKSTSAFPTTTTQGFGAAPPNPFGAPANQPFGGQAFSQPGSTPMPQGYGQPGALPFGARPGEFGVPGAQVDTCF